MATPRIASRFAIALVLFGLRDVSAATLAVPGAYRTISAAVRAARDGDTIEVAPGTYTEQVLFLESSRNLTLRGNPADPSTVIVDGNGVHDSVFRIQDWTGSLLIEGFTITGGRGTDGYAGGIHISHADDVVFRDCAVVGNHSAMHGGGANLIAAGGLFQRCVFHDNAADQLGGGALVQTGSTTVFAQCQFVNNTAGVVDPQNGGGGGLYVRDSSPTLVGCLVQGNSGKFAGGGIGILTTFDAPRAEVVLRDTTITENTVARANASMPPAEGGGMHIEDNSHVVLERCRVTKNNSNQGAGLNAFRAHYTIIDSIIEDNVDGGDVAAFGGGIFAAANDTLPGHEPATVELIRSVVRRNSAPGGAGIFMIGDFANNSTRAVLDMTGSIIADNAVSDTTRSGAGMYLDRMAATIRGSMILDNHGSTYGGGILAMASTVLTIDDTTLAGNDASNQGGAICIDQGGGLTITNSRLIGNTAPAAAGAAAIAVFDHPGPLANPPITGTVTNSVFADNGPNFQIVEADCDPATRSTVQYVGNTFATPASPVYWGACQLQKTTAADFNTLAGKASANVSGTPSIAAFLAAPASLMPGQASVLGWVAHSANPLAITPGIGTPGAAAGTVDVTPAATTTYQLATPSTLLGSATVDVGCAAIETPIPRAPHDGAHGVAGNSAVLTWYESAGATAYDVYLDGTAEPDTLVAQDLTTPTVTIDGLAPDQEYRWRVAARGPGCTVPSLSPTFVFRTRSASGYEFDDDFADGDASDWATSGPGSATVQDGALVLRGRNLMALAPVPAAGDGMMSMSIRFDGGRRRGALVFAYRDAKNYRALALNASARYQLYEQSGGRRRIVKRGRWMRAGADRRTVTLEIIGQSVKVSLPGADFSAAFAAAAAGRFGIQAMQSRLSIDDVAIVTY